MVENLRIQDPAIPTETIQTTYVNLLKTMLKKTNLYVKYYTNDCKRAEQQYDMMAVICFLAEQTFI